MTPTYALTSATTPPASLPCDLVPQMERSIAAAESALAAKNKFIEELSSQNLILSQRISDLTRQIELQREAHASQVENIREFAKNYLYALTIIKTSKMDPSTYERELLPLLNFSTQELLHRMIQEIASLTAQLDIESNREYKACCKLSLSIAEQWIQAYKALIPKTIKALERNIPEEALAKLLSDRPSEYEGLGYGYTTLLLRVADLQALQRSGKILTTPIGKKVLGIR